MVFGIVALTTIFIVLGVEVDYGRLFVTRHKDQVIADACVLAASIRMPKQAQADAEINRVRTRYNQYYNSSYSATATYGGGPLPMNVQVTVTENVPMFLPGLMGNPTRQTRATAGVTLYPAGRVPNLEPIGVQFDRNFGLPLGWLPTGMTSSPTELQLKNGTGNGPALPGNFYPLALNSSTGADNYRQNMNTGAGQPYTAGDIVQTEPGNMTGPTNQGLDDRMLRASDPRFANDNADNFLPDNPHVVYFPLVDWLAYDSLTGRSSIQLKGSAAFWITRYSGGQIYGRFVRTVVLGATIDGNGGVFDNGLYAAKMTQ
jgi:hypothetical protein